MNSIDTPTAVGGAAVLTPNSKSQPVEASRKRHLVANVVGSIVILGLGIAGYLLFGQKPEVPTDTSKQDAANAAPLVEVAEVQAWDQPFQIEIDGEAATYRVLTVGAEVTGRVADKSEATRSGTFVNKGDVLFEIDSVNYQLEAQRLQARVDQAQEELTAVDVDLQNTVALLKLLNEENQLQQNHLERIRSLYVKKAASESDMDTAARQELTSRNTLQTQQNQQNTLQQTKKTKIASLKLAQAELERTKIDLQRCRIVSPITGRIVDDLHEVGDYVKPGDPLVHVSDSSRMEIKCSLKAEELAWVWQQRLIVDPKPIATSESIASESAASDAETDARKPDPFKMPQVPCEIAFEFQGIETIWDGHLSRYEGTGIDRDTRMFPCRVIVEQPEKTRTNSIAGRRNVAPPTLLSGMYVSVRIPITSPVPLLRVPAEAVRPGQQLWIVRNGTLKIISISLVRVDGETALVQQESGSIKIGDNVVTSPLASINDGMSVRIVAAQDANETATASSAPVASPEVKP